MKTAARAPLRVGALTAAPNPGGLSLSGTEPARFLHHKVLRIDKDKWSGLPVLLLDATLPDDAILRTWFPDIVTTRICAEMPHTRLRQVIGAPVAAGKLASEDAPAARRREVRRYILQRWIETGRGETLVVCQLGYEKWLEGGLPPSIKIAHFGAIEGLDGFKRVRLLISIGRAIPGPQDAEELAALLSGRQRDVTLTHYNGGGAWFDRQFGGVTLADGSWVGVEQDYHPDELVEAIRWQQHEAKVIQAVGRARAVNRGAENPLSIDIVNNAPLPIVIDEAVHWEPPSSLVEMLADGVVLTSPQDIHAAWPDIFESERTAKRFVAELDELTLGKIWDRTNDIGWMRAAYQWDGNGQRPRTAFFLPSSVPDLRAWLLERAWGGKPLKAVVA